MKVRDVERKNISGYENVFLRKDFNKYIELPCLEACLWFYDLNIQTASCNCHKDNPNVNLSFNAESLDEENMKIAKNLVREGILKYYESPDGRNKWFKIEFPATIDDDVEEISNRLLSVAKKFQYQDVLAPGWRVSEKDYYRSLIKYVFYPELCDKYGIRHQIEITDDGKSIMFDDDDFEKLQNDGKLYEFYDYLLELLKSSFQEKIELGEANEETRSIFSNTELCDKHREYLESQKSKGVK